MHSNLDWVHSHSRLQVRALEWQAKNSDTSYLLRGADLKGAESWLARAAGQPIHPTPLHSQYILASRAAATRAQKRNLSIAIGVATVASALAIVAIIQYFAAKRQTVIAQHQTRIATAGRISATAISLKDSQFDLGSLLAVEASRIEDTFDTRNAQVTLFESNPDLVTYLHQPGAQADFIDSIAFTPDGKRFATATDEGVITLWNADTRTAVTTLPAPPKPSNAYQIAFSPNSSILAVAYDHEVGLQLWNVEGPQPALIQPAAPFQPDSLSGVAFHPTVEVIAAGGNGGFQLWTFPQLQPLRQPGMGTFIQGLAFSPTDPMLLAYTVAGVIHLENPATGQSRGEIKLPSPPVAPSNTAVAPPGTDTFGKLAFSPDGTQIAAGPRRGTIGIWKLEPRGSGYASSLREALPLGDNGIPMGIAFRPDGKELVAISNHGTMRKWDTASLKLLRDYPATLTTDIRSLAFTQNGSQIFAGLNSGIMLIWNDSDLTLRPVDKSLYPDAGTTPLHLDGPPSTAQPWIEAPTGNAARLTPRGVEARVRGRSFILPGSPLRATQLAISPDGRFVAAASLEDSAHSRALWDISQPTPRAIPLQGIDNITFALAFSPSSDLLATAEFTGLYLWDTATGKLTGQNVEPNRSAALDVAFSPDGNRIALVLNGGEVLLIDEATQRLLGAPIYAGSEDFGGKSSTVAFTHDGRSLLIRNPNDGTVLQWDADSNLWADRACRVASRNLSLEEWSRYIGDAIPYHRTCSQYPNGAGVPK